MAYPRFRKVTVLADKSPDGTEFNAPNDGMVHPDGWLLFTDPGYGALMDYEGHRLAASAKSVQPIQKEAVYRVDAPGKIEKVADEPFKPNGLCFSPDFKKVYIADTGVSHYPNAKAQIWVYDLDGKRLRNPRTFASTEYNGKTGFADGIRCDEDGNVWAGMGWVGDGYDGVHVFAADGARIGVIRMPEIIANVCFGGPSGTGCSWPAASRCTRSTSRRGAERSLRVPATMRPSDRRIHVSIRLPGGRRGLLRLGSILRRPR